MPIRGSGARESGSLGEVSKITQSSPPVLERHPGAARVNWLPYRIPWPWSVTFSAIVVILLTRGGFLFTTPLHESGDTASNSILVIQAEHFTLLHGNYSREGFFHPGPGYIYILAAGQAFFYGLLHAVPTPWNGQLIAVAIANSAMVATVVWLIHSWTRSAWATLAAAVAVLGYLDAHPLIIASAWMPFLYVPTFFCFIVSAASVAAGRSGHLWVLAATGCLLIHGHACFLLFVPVIVAATAAAAVLLSAGSPPLTAIRRFFRERKAHWIPAVVTGLLFAVPVIADVILHWPGQFGAYLGYARSGRAGHHDLLTALRYLLWYWWPHRGWIGLAVGLSVGLSALALGVSLRVADPALRRFLLAALGMNALVSVLMLYYAMRGIDDLRYPYMGYFYWSVPVLTLIVMVIGLVAVVSGTRSRQRVPVTVVIVTAALAAICAAFVVSGMRMDVRDNERVLVPAMASLAARDPGRPIIFHTAPKVQADALGLVLQAERTGVRACLSGPYLQAFFATSEFTCDARDYATGVSYWMHDLPYQAGRGVTVVARLRYSEITTTGG